MTGIGESLKGPGYEPLWSRETGSAGAFLFSDRKAARPEARLPCKDKNHANMERRIVMANTNEQIAEKVVAAVGGKADA